MKHEANQKICISKWNEILKNKTCKVKTSKYAIKWANDALSTKILKYPK